MNLFGVIDFTYPGEKLAEIVRNRGNCVFCFNTVQEINVTVMVKYLTAGQEFIRPRRIDRLHVICTTSFPAFSLSNRHVCNFFPVYSISKQEKLNNCHLVLPFLGYRNILLNVSKLITL